jgi:hypothetical protein
MSETGVSAQTAHFHVVSKILYIRSVHTHYLDVGCPALEMERRRSAITTFIPDLTTATRGNDKGGIKVFTDVFKGSDEFKVYGIKATTTLTGKFRSCEMRGVPLTHVPPPTAAPPALEAEDLRM